MRFLFLFSSFLSLSLFSSRFRDIHRASRESAILPEFPGLAQLARMRGGVLNPSPLRATICGEFSGRKSPDYRGIDVKRGGRRGRRGMNSAVFCRPLIGLNPSLSFPLSHPSLRPVLPLYNKTGTRCIMREKKGGRGGEIIGRSWNVRRIVSEIPFTSLSLTLVRPSRKYYRVMIYDSLINN